MIEDEELPARASAREREGDGYAYDFFKFLTSLSLLTLAGIFAISQMQNALGEIGKVTLIATMATVAAGGIASFIGVNQIVIGKTTGTDESRKIKLLMKLAPALYCIGVGGALMMFLDVMY
jgi:hypothetical protein